MTAPFYQYNYNRLEKIDYPDMKDVYYGYGSPGAKDNGAGRVISIDNGDVQETRKYGRMGEVIESTRKIRITVPTLTDKTYTTKYQFDSMGRMHQMVYPDGEILQYTYDAGGMLKSAIGKTNGKEYVYVKEIKYDALGQRTRMELGNGDITTYE